MKEKTCRECGGIFNLSDKLIEYYISKNFNEPERCLNCRREKRRMEYVPCKDCGIVFSMDGLEMKFYEKQGFMMPKRCPTCRKRRREVKC